MPKDVLVLNREEAKIVADVLLQEVARIGGGESQPDQQRLFRLAVKLDQFHDGLHWPGTLFENLPDWARGILYRTFNPPRVTPKKKAKPALRRKGTAPAGKAKPATAPAAAGAASPAETPAPFPPPRARVKESAATAAAPADGSTSAPAGPGVKLTGSAARRLGGLKRAMAVAEAKGNRADALRYRQRIEDLLQSAQAVAVAHGEAAGD